MFSIIMPVFNSEAFIEDALTSVLNQTFDDFELICLNDNTPDKAFKICKEYSEKDKRIICVDSNQNLGQGQTRNKGIEIAKGEYIIFLDSDDLIKKETLMKLRDSIKDNDADCVFFNFENFYEKTNIRTFVSATLDSKVFTIDECKLMILDELNHDFLSCIGNKAYKTGSIRKNNIRFSEKYRFNEDLAFALEFIATAKVFSYLNETLYLYRRRETGSTMTTYRKNMMDTVLEARLNYLKFINIHNENKFNQTKQKTTFVRNILGCFYDSLRNEKKFGNKQTFKEVVEKCNGLEIFKFLREYIRFNKKCFDFKKRLFLRLVANRSVFLWSLIR